MMDDQAWDAGRAALERACEAGDAAGAAAAIAALLDEQGYVHVGRAIHLDLFERICERLGEVILRTDVQLDFNRVSAALRPEPLGFHNDSPLADIIGWYCVHQDAGDGATLFLDCGDLVDHLAPADLAALAKLPVRYPEVGKHDPDHGRFAYLEEPLLRAAAKGWRIYYAPWLVGEPGGDEERSALGGLGRYLAHKEAAGPVSVRLESGECCFVDNHRMLHGRKELPRDSRRLLKRRWLRRAAAASGEVRGGA